MRPEYDALITYSSADRDQAEKLAARLREAGLRVWFDYWSVVPGENWYRELAEALERSGTVLVLVGPHGFDEPRPRGEIMEPVAMRTRREHYRLIPVLLPGALPTNLPLFLRTRVYCDLREWDEAVLDQLIESLRPVPRVFLCHAKEDEQRVTDLYDYLSAEGIDAWYDKEKLSKKVGASWRDEIISAIEQSDFFALCLSSTSVRKRGFVQNEIRTAVEEWRKRPPGSIFLLPIRLESCELPS